MDINFRDRIIFITGGTSTLGGAFVEAARREGAAVWFSYHRNKEAARRLEALGARAVSLDLTAEDESGIDAIKAAIKKAHGRLDVLINNAAAVRDQTITRLGAEDWDRIIQADLGAVFRTTKTLLPLLYKSSQGRILNLTSRLAFTGGYGASNYAAAKAGLVAFTKSLAREVGRKGILVNALNPGFMISAMTRGLSESVKMQQKAASLLSEYSDPAEVAEFMLYLVSDRVRRVTGQTFHYDSRPV